MGDTAISSLSFEFFSPGSRARGTDSSIASPIDDSKLSPNCCLGRTCLKWGADGELSAVDKQLVLQRLALEDKIASDLLQKPFAIHRE
jgi:hypothetical protein